MKRQHRYGNRAEQRKGKKMKKMIVLIVSIVCIAGIAITTASVPSEFFD